MAFWNRSKSGVTNQERLTVLNLAVDEDFSLFEVASKFSNVPHAREVVRDLFDKGMVDLYWKKPKGGRDKVTEGRAEYVLDGEEEWRRKPSFEVDYVVVAANDQGWRWHQKHWKADMDADNGPRQGHY